ncbi:MAG: hypothetical protein J6A41_01225 [Ruminiclostridium sp.]|nr:hypothetical protein [Ruminiclostridium sp.]
MTKKILSLILAAMVIAVSACSSTTQPAATTTAAVAPSEAWEYEMYIEDLAYFGDRYLQGTYAAQSAFSMMNEADAKKHLEGALEALISLEGVIYPPNLEETHGKFLQTVEIHKELTECRLDIAGYISEYPDLSPEESAEYEKADSRMNEISGRIEEGGYTFNKYWIAAQNAAYSYLHNGEYRAYSAELKYLLDTYDEQFIKFCEIYFNGDEGDIAIHLNNSLTLLSNIENMTVPEQLKSCHEEIKKAMPAERGAIQAMLTITNLYRQYPGTEFADMPAEVQDEIDECSEIFYNFFSENNSDYYALNDAIHAALEAADTQAGQ